MSLVTFKRIFLFGALAIVTVTTACTEKCPEGTVSENGVCVRSAVMDAGAGQDAGRDADAGLVQEDAPMTQVDASGCGTCAGSTPICDTSRDECVACLDDSDCGEETPHCLEGACFACIEDTDCGTPELSRCDPVSHQCVICSDASQCSRFEDAPVCNPSLGCSECYGDTGCEGRIEGICEAGACVECGDSVHCEGTPARPRCDPSTHTCEPCLSDDDCSGISHLPYCLASTGACVACASDTDCTDPRASSCAAEIGVCRGCSDDDECDHIPGLQECVWGACVECDGDSTCPDAAEARCDAATDTCSPCTADSQCAHLTDTPVCEEGTGRCVECTTDAEYAACNGNSCNRTTLTCTNTPVLSLSSCEPCQTDSECGSVICAPFVLRSTMLGYYCMPLLAYPHCNAAGMYATYSNVNTASGRTVNTCFPRTSCEAIEAYGRSCTSQSQCSGFAYTVDGSACRGTTGSLECSYVCLENRDCPTGSSCVSGFCQ